ncbi:MAG: TolC family protein [Smithella sp.]|nr:TolC family protein [Smithella sp.]
MRKKIFFLFLLFFIPAQSVFAADDIKKGDVLSLGQCIAIALKNHPALSAAAGAVDQSESKIGKARSGYYPQLSLQSGYSRIGPPSSSLSNSSYDYYSNALNLNQTLFDFGKTSTAVDIQKLGKQSAQADFQDTATALTYSVQEAYFSLLKTRMSEIVAVETVNQFQQHLEMARTFFETGKSSRIDVTSAEVNLSNARIQLISAQNALLVARVNLNKAMGVIAAPEYEIEDNFNTEAKDIPFEAALARAYENRPDIQSIVLKKYALEKTIDLNKKDYLPILSGNAAYGYAGQDAALNQSWNVGVALTFPFFTGFSTRYAVEEARADLEIAKAHEEALRQNVFQEVKSAWLNRHEAFERIEAGKLTVRQAEESVELAQGRYATGVGNSLEIVDAMIKLNNARMTHIAALSDFNIAEASLEKAMGAKTP